MSSSPDAETDSPPDARTFSGNGVKIIKQFDPELDDKYPAILYEISLEVDEPREVVIEDSSPAHVDSEEQIVGYLKHQEQYWYRNEEYGYMGFKRTIPADQEESFAVLGVKEEGLGSELMDVTPTIKINGETISESTTSVTSESSTSAPSSDSDSQSEAPAAPGVNRSETADQAAPDQSSSSADQQSNSPATAQAPAQDQDREPAAPNGATPAATDPEPGVTSEPASEDTPSGEDTLDEPASDAGGVDPQAAADIEASADRAEQAAEEAREAAAVAENATDAAIETAEKVEALAGETSGTSSEPLLEQLTDELAEADDEQVAAFREQVGLNETGGLSTSDTAHVEHLATKVSEMEAYIDKMEAFIDENGDTQETVQSVQNKQTELETDIDELEGEVEQDIAELEADLNNLRDAVAEVNEEIETIQQLRDVLGTNADE